MELKDLQSYTLLKEQEIKELNSKGYIMEHKKTGARVVLLSNDDNNKVFTIGFRTPPENSTGVPHIIEHSVLCGSKKFPAKDPFVELVKGSLNTFLNAMTYPDKTIYPVASCNDRDFQNLLDVYMDAVFNTNIYSRRQIFMQEGWHYEMEDENAPLTINGVVYNEMKGAYSSPDSALENEIMRALYPDAVYSRDSGGDPDVIPELTYEQFLEFHRTYYHPSNSYIYLYGDMDMAEKLDYIDREYLSTYDRKDVDSVIKKQKLYSEPVNKKVMYPISSSESEEEKTYFSYSTVIEDSLDEKLYLAFQIIEYALISSPGAPLKQALLDAKIGKEVYSTYENGIRQPYFSIVAKDADEKKEEEFVKVIKNTFENIVKNGINEKALLAGINSIEFKHREADYGSAPSGLLYGIQIFDSWLYDDSKPFVHICENETFAFLKENVKTGYFEKLIEKYLLNNPHTAIVTAIPKAGLSAERDREFEEKLKAYRDSLSAEEIKEIVDNTRELKKYQEEPSTKEELASIPMLAREDIGREPAPLYNEEKEIDGTTVIHHNMFTNEIGYLRLMFRTNKVRDELLPYVGILRKVLGYVDTANHTYNELYNDINIYSGGIRSGITSYKNTKMGNYKAYFEISSKVLYDKLQFAFDTIEEIITTSKIDDEKRLHEIIGEFKSQLSSGILSSGHTAALGRAMSYQEESAKFVEAVKGIDLFKEVERIEADFDNCKEELIANLKETAECIFKPENLIVSYTADDEGYRPLEDMLVKFKKCLNTKSIDDVQRHLEVKQLNEGFKCSSQIQYVAMCGNYKRAGYNYTGALDILRVILSYDYLWNNVRVKGGAYGCMNAFLRAGDTYLVSYRDPNLTKTIDIYRGLYDFVKNFDADERDMTKYVIGTISDFDVPMNPAAKGARSFAAYLNNLTMEDYRRERAQIIDATVDDIRALADIVKSVVDQNNICVIGNESVIETEKDIFTNVCNMFD